MYKKALIAVGALALCLSPVEASAVQQDNEPTAADTVQTNAAQTDDVRPMRGPVQLQNAKTGKCLRGGRNVGQLVTQAKCDKDDDWQFWGDRAANQIINWHQPTGSFTCLGSDKITTLKGCADPGVSWIGGLPGDDYRAIGSRNGDGCFLKVDDKGAIKCTPGFTSKSAQWRSR